VAEPNLCEYLSVSAPANPAEISLSGGSIGVLVLHGFMGSPASIRPWAEGLHAAGFTVLAPCLAGHGISPSNLNATTWVDWYRDAERAFLKLKEQCTHVFVAGFSMGGGIALRLAEIRGSEIAGTLLVNAAIFDDRFSMRLVPALSKIIPSIPAGPTDCKKPNPPAHILHRVPLRALNSLRKFWRLTERDLYLVDTPLMVSYSVEDHTVHPVNSETIIDNVYSVDIREVIFENSYHNVALDYDSDSLIEESVIFIHDVLSGELSRNNDIVARISEADERDLIDAEFESIVSGLSLDESAPTTYLDELDAGLDPDGFERPNPILAPADHISRWAVAGMVGGLALIFLYLLIGFDPIGLGPWPGIFAFIGGVATWIWKSARKDDEVDPGDDGAIV
jgi:carboxylesterase